MKIHINELTKTYSGDLILDNLSLEIIKGSKSAIVGENGSGKSTLLKILSKIEPFDSGQVHIPKDMNVGYMRQTYTNFPGNAKEYILSAFDDYKTLKARLSDLELAMSDTSDLYNVFKKYSNAQEKFELMGGYELENSLDSYAKGLGVYHLLEQGFSTLSGGEKTRISLVQLLLQDYEVICLDEPTNHLDTSGIEWLESFCNSTSKTLLIVSHDREFLKNIVSVYHEIEDGKIVSYHGDYDSYRLQRHERYLRLVDDFDEQQRQIQKLTLAAKRYRQWGNESDNEDFFKKAKAVEKRIARIDRLPKPVEIRNQLNLKFEVKVRSGKIVCAADNLAIGYDTVLKDSIDFQVNWRDRFAIVADNGVGKSTLIKTILGELDAKEGQVRVGESVKFSYLPQELVFVDSAVRILAYIQKSCELDEEKARRYLARFGFYQHDMYKPVSYLSGGEQVRLKLLEMMLSDSNCLILDEPTNHLDIMSCEIIEEALREYEGTIIVVSHDRMFLNKLGVSKFYLKNI